MEEGGELRWRRGGFAGLLMVERHGEMRESEDRQGRGTYMHLSRV